MKKELTEEELARYNRHILLPELGVAGQHKIREAKVLVVGTGGLGSPVCLYLAAAGVGEIGIIDGDVVDVSNLQRQVIHRTHDLGTPKVLSAKEKMLAINPHVKVNAMRELLTDDNAEAIIAPYDFVVDCTDNFRARFLINDTCVRMRKPFNYGSIMQFEGQTFTCLPGTTCLRCIYGAAPPEDVVPPASKTGVLGAIAGMVGTVQAAEVLKFITGTGELLTNKLLTFDARTMDFRKITLFRNPECAACGGK